MKWQDLIIEAYGRVLQALERALEGLSPDDLTQQPDPNCNSMGWLVWHLTRGQDAMLPDSHRSTKSGLAIRGTRSSIAPLIPRILGSVTVRKT